MDERGAHRDRRSDAADVGDPNAWPPSELEALSLYDSLLRAVAAAPPSVRIPAEVGPNGKFVLQQEIGSGAMGRVYRAIDRYLLRDVAIKFLLRPEGMNHDDFMALFWQEAHIIAHLDHHDNIIRILDVDRSSYPPFIVMEYLDGVSLEKLLKRGPIEMATSLRIMIGAARGLREAHARGVYHRDLKPSNIFVQKTGRVKLIDFGLARIRNRLFEASPTKDQFVSVHGVPPLANAGTPGYMAPEQWRGAEPDTATDLWAMGAILYRLFANAPPFDASSLTTLCARVLSGIPPAPLGRLCPQLPSAICDLVERLLRHDRTQRPSDLGEVLPVLESALTSLSHDMERAPTTPALQSYPGSLIRRGSGHGHRHAQGSGPENAHRASALLLVLVPGADPNAQVIPDQLATWLQQHVGVDVEILWCRPGRSEEIADSAAHIAATLGQRTRLRHICFITHGDGTSAVVRMLLDEARRLRRPGPQFELDIDSLFYRTRRVTILEPGSVDAHWPGEPEAPTQALVSELVAESAHFLAATLPTPAVTRVDAADVLRGDAEAVRALALLFTRPEAVLVQETITRTFELDCAARSTSLIERSDLGDPEVEPTVPGAAGATQAEVFDEVVAFACRQHPRPAAMVIAGDAGVGKSTVLRTVARRLSTEFLASDSGGVLPILLPLYFATLSADQLAAFSAEASPDKRGRMLQDVLLEWWCGWFNEITYGETFGLAWLTARLRSSAVLVVLDGIDEFMTNHPGMSVSDFRQLLAFMTTEYRANSRLTVVLGVRSSHPGLALLGGSCLREVARLTPAQAVRRFPAASAWLNATGEVSIQRLLHTPLILAQLNTRRPPSNLRPSTRGEVVLLALNAIIEQSDLIGKADDSGRPIDAQGWIDALTAVSWCMFRRLRGEIATSRLRFDATDLHRSWAEHLERTGQQTEGERLLAGFRLLCESRPCDLLLRRTVLYLTGRGEIRFIHREWQDFLAAAYLAHVVVYRYVDEFRHVGNTARISRMAGELLCQSDVCIDESFVQGLLARAREPGGDLITANFAALVTNSRLLMDGPAIEAFLAAIDTMQPVARCITLIGLGYRALRGDDASAHDLRHGLVRVFRNDQAAGTGVDDLGVMRSIAWCYRKAYAQRFGGPALREPWPGLDEPTERSVLAMMCSTTGDGPRLRPEHRSIQLALLEVQHVVGGDPYRPISGIHYLYCLCVARHHGAGIAELGREVPALLAHDSPYAAAIESYTPVPELRQILAQCRQLELAR